MIMPQSVAHRDADPSLLHEYGMVIVDECHAVGAPAAEAAIRQVAVKRWIGLSATPYRADQMDALITMQCGPIRHEITAEVSLPSDSSSTRPTSTPRKSETMAPPSKRSTANWPQTRPGPSKSPPTSRTRQAGAGAA
ncbi:hypothetical protein FE391_06045 [Nonomuraea sp. KC401]|nr:DEAD/DEAH box helicase family protein [Nonomuraea sp. K271]TLF81855.1 hypothetical protein FE391_06045 [Nonomuraea sp. KC401]